MIQDAKLSRRRFVGASAAAAIAPMLVGCASSRKTRRKSPNERINIGFIGYGKRSRSLLRRCLVEDDTQVVAVSEVVRERLEHGRETIDKYYKEEAGRASYRGCDAYNDFRQIIARDDIDAVVIGTPDFWHAIQVVMAAESGKDIYCEKPMALVIKHGRKMVDAVRRNDIVFQTGSQQRSEFGGRFRKAVECIRDGRIGKIQTVHVGVGGPPIPCELPTQACPAGTDWEMWNSPAPERGYNEILCPKGIHDHFPDFRSYREYAGGGLADFGAHHFDIAQWGLGMDNSGPVKIVPPKGDATSGLVFTYADGTVMVHGGPSGCTFKGTEGTIYVDRSKLTSDTKGVLEDPFDSSAMRFTHSENHMRNWLDCVHSRDLPVCDVEVGHRTASICQLAQTAYELRRPLTWDPKRERYAGDSEANKLRDREIRGSWKL